MTQGIRDIKMYSKSRKESNGNMLTSYHLNQLNRILVSGLSKGDNKNVQRLKYPYKDGKIKL